MIDRVLEYLQQIAENFGDHYWWMRHQMLMASLIAIATGVIGLLFTWLESRITTQAAVTA